MTPTPTKRTKRTASKHASNTNSKATQAKGNSTPALKAAVSASRMRDLEHSQAKENHQNTERQYDEKEEEISELEAQKEIAKQKRDDEVQKARQKIQKAKQKIQKAEQQYEVENNYIDQKILLAKKDRRALKNACNNDRAAVHSAERRAQGARIDVLVHNGGVEKAADIIVAHTLTSSVQGLGSPSADQSPPFALPPPPPPPPPAAAAATGGGGGGGGGGNIRRSARLSTSRYASSSMMLAGESKPANRDGGVWIKAEHQPGGQIDSESKPWSKCDDEDDIISISSGGSESDDGIKCGRRSKKKAPAKSATQKKTPAKTPNSRKKLVKDLPYAELRAHRRPIEAKSKRKNRQKTKEKQEKLKKEKEEKEEELQKALEFINTTPALRQQKNEENHFNICNRVLDIGTDIQKDMFALAKGDAFASKD